MLLSLVQLDFIAPLIAADEFISTALLIARGLCYGVQPSNMQWTEIIRILVSLCGTKLSPLDVWRLVWPSLMMLNRDGGLGCWLDMNRRQGISSCIGASCTDKFAVRIQLQLCPGACSFVRSAAGGMI